MKVFFRKLRERNIVLGFAKFLVTFSLLLCLAVNCSEPSSNPSGGGNNGNSKEDTINPSLPGTTGGKTNSNDVFAGKTFYDSAEKASAETKYIFSDDGTISVVALDEDGESTVAKFNYSLSTDGKKVYMTYNSVNEKNYEDSLKELSFENIKIQLEVVPDIVKADMKYSVGLSKSASDEELIEAISNSSKNWLKKISSTVYEFDIVSSSETQVAIEEVNKCNGDISKLSSIFAVFKSDDGKFQYLLDAPSGGLLNNSYIYSADSSKLYVMERADEKKTEVSYLLEGTGKNMKIKADFGGITYEAKYTDYKAVFYILDSSDPTPSSDMPGKAGGKDNENDTFAGKTFCDNADKTAAQIYYEFSETGTVTLKAQMLAEEQFTAVSEIKYSISDDGSTVYMKVLKSLTPEATPKLLPEEEYISYAKTMIAQSIKDDDIKAMLAGFSDEERAAYCLSLNISALSTDDEIIEATKNETVERTLVDIRRVFSSTYTYTLEKGTSPEGTLTEIITWKDDLSKFITMGGLYKNADDADYEFNLNTESLGAVRGSYNITEEKTFSLSEDSSEFVSDDELSISYTLAEDGKTLSITVDGKEMTATYQPHLIELFPME